MYMDIKEQTYQLIDDLKAVCHNYGMGIVRFVFLISYVYIVPGCYSLSVTYLVQASYCFRDQKAAKDLRARLALIIMIAFTFSMMASSSSM